MRIRTIKPEFFTHEGIFDAELESGLPLRIAFIGLWCAADREGRFRWEPRRLKVQILPYEDVDFSEVMDSLEQFGFIKRYGEGQFGCIPTFASHQCINQRESQSKIPKMGEPDDTQSMHMHARAYRCVHSGVNVPRKLRELVFERDGMKCCRCESGEDLTVDHIFPRSIGGTHAITNLRTLCRSCNSARPVAGKALIEDLKKDGLTLGDMQRTCTHVHAHAEGKGREGKGREQYAPSEEAAGVALSDHASASKINTSESEEGDFLFGPDGPAEVVPKVSVPRKEPARPVTAPVETKDPRHHEITSQIAQPYNHVTGKPFPFSPKFAKVLQRFLAGWNGTADEFLDAYHDAMQASTKPYASGCLTKAHDPSFFCLNYAEVVAATMRVEVNEKRQRIKAPF
jgi:hypothetical protein